MKAELTGTCWCGCGKATEGHFAQGHDRRAQEALLDIVYGSGIIADKLAQLGYGPNHSVVEASQKLEKARQAR